MWSRDGKELFYISLGRRRFAVQVDTEGDFSARGETLLFEYGRLSPFDVSLDGQRFLAWEPEDGDTDTPDHSISVLQNWQAKYFPEP